MLLWLFRQGSVYIFCTFHFFFQPHAPTHDSLWAVYEAENAVATSSFSSVRCPVHTLGHISTSHPLGLHLFLHYTCLLITVPHSGYNLSGSRRFVSNQECLLNLCHQMPMPFSMGLGTPLVTRILVLGDKDLFNIPSQLAIIRRINDISPSAYSKSKITFLGKVSEGANFLLALYSALI